MSVDTPLASAAHDFDFLHGSWNVHNRRRVRVLDDCADWYAFEGTAIERVLWDGQGNIEEYDAELPDGARIRGLALRLYDPNARQWTIHWSSSATGKLDPPLTGTFIDGRGEFRGRDTHHGRGVLVRFYWIPVHEDAARWEQAFSADDGRSWETNWIMEFTRASAAP